MEDFDELFRRVLDQVKTSDIDRFARAYHRFQDELEIIVGAATVTPKGKAQCTQFMTHLLPHIHAHMRQFPRRSSFSILDIGPGTGNGSDLLGFLYAHKGLGYAAKVTTLDIEPRTYAYMRTFCRHVTPTVGRLEKLQGPFDIVIASHVIEHVPDPVEFVQHMQRISRGIAIVCAPYKEPLEMLSPHHLHIFDDAFLANLGAEQLEVLASPGWGQFMEPPYRMFIAVLEGQYPKRRMPPSVRPSVEPQR